MGYSMDKVYCMFEVVEDSHPYLLGVFESLEQAEQGVLLCKQQCGYTCELKVKEYRLGDFE